MNPIKTLKNALFSDEYDIQHKLLNITLTALCIGGFISLIATIFLDFNPVGILMITLVDIFLGWAVYFSVIKRKQNIALVLTCIVDLTIFPAMYFTMGGMVSGMPVWFVVSLVILWIILKMPYCIIMYVLNVAILVGCLLFEMYYPEYIHTIDTQAAIVMDIIQSMLVVSILFGVIFKYQTHIYGKQSNSLKQQTIELREAMLALERANEAKNEFLTNMSHEIRTPINAIIGMDEIILRESNSDSITQYAGSIKNASHVLLEFVNNILDFSKIESGLMEIEEYNYKFDALLNSINKIIEPKISKKGLEYKLTVDDEIPKFMTGDNYKISRVVTHLLTNAVKYTEKGYVALTFGCEKIDEDKVNLVIRVADTGVGIPEDSIKTLFDGFNRIDIKRHRNIEGLGLGLAVTKRLVELMGGTIDARSVYGSGSIFTIRLTQEIACADEVNTDAENMVVGHFAAPKAKILAVDDNKINLEVIKHLLKKYEIETDLAPNGDECMRMCHGKCYDLIFMDHMMPSPDGIETLRMLHGEDNLNHDTPVVVLTANAIAGAREEYLKEGFAEYLSKPIDVTDLEKVLRKMLHPRLIEYRKPVKHENTDVMYSPGGDEWVDREVGLKYFSDDEELYNEILGSYYEQSRKYQDELPSYVENSDWKNYTITVHAIKSTSLNIGASRFSSMAKEQEMLGKAADADQIRNSFENFMKCFDEVLKSVEKMIGVKEPQEAVELSEEQYILILNELREYTENFEMNSALKCIETLRNSTASGIVSENVSGMLDDIENSVEKCDYEYAVKLVSEVISRCQK